MCTWRVNTVIYYYSCEILFLGTSSRSKLYKGIILQTEGAQLLTTILCINNMTQSNKDSDNMSSQIDYTTPTPRFSVTNNDTLNDGIAYLNEHGYAVISDVMNQDEINVNKNLLWKFLENFSNNTIRRDDPETWSNEW